MAKAEQPKLDAEFKAMDQCIKAIRPLGSGAAERVIAYLKQRFVDHKDFS